jgi:hypothetical protein
MSRKIVNVVAAVIVATGLVAGIAATADSGSGRNIATTGCCKM